MLQLFVASGPRWQLLRDLNLEFKSFNTSNDDLTGLGLAYRYSKNIKRDELVSRAATQSGLSLSFDAEGNIAFEREINPRDFLQTSVDFAFFRSTGGAVRTTPAVRNELNAMEDVLTSIQTEEELFASPVWQTFLAAMQHSMTTQTYWELGASVRYESNQAFTAKQLVYSGQLGLDVKAWNDGATLARWNLIDWPAALVRLLDGVDTRFTPRGSTIPTVLTAIDWVDPSDNAVREAVGEMDSYPRFRIETAYKSLVAEHADHEVYWLMDLRYYREISPPDAIKAINADDFLYFVTALTIGESLYVSYSDGRLPFDAADDRVYELGFKVAF